MAKKELKLHAVVAPTQTGEVTNILAEESILNDKNKIMLSALKPIIYNEEAFEYLALGEKVGDAFRMGAELKNSLE